MEKPNVNCKDPFPISFDAQKWLVVIQGLEMLRALGDQEAADIRRELGEQVIAYDATVNVVCNCANEPREGELQQITSRADLTRPNGTVRLGSSYIGGPVLTDGEV